MSKAHKKAQPPTWRGTQKTIFGRRACFFCRDPPAPPPVSEGWSQGPAPMRTRTPGTWRLGFHTWNPELKFVPVRSESRSCWNFNGAVFFLSFFFLRLFPPFFPVFFCVSPFFLFFGPTNFVFQLRRSCQLLRTTRIFLDSVATIKTMVGFICHHCLPEDCHHLNWVPRPFF